MLLLGFGAVSMVHKDAWDVAEALLRFLHVNPDHHHYAQVFLNLADNVTDAKLWAMAAGAAAYSIVRFVEAYGLWRERTWAEWFALISGALYVPFESTNWYVGRLPFMWPCCSSTLQSFSTCSI